MVDVNVWLALATERHEHHQAARRWFTSIGEEEAAFCRVTQMGLLRMLTAKAVMAGDVLSPRDAWGDYKKLRRDWRVTFAQEPDGFEALWIALMSDAAAGTSWTDAYLAAFALGHAFTMVSFDRGFSRWKQVAFRPLLHETV